jgi:hypothetical protein
MTASQSCKSARSARWLSTGHGRVRSDFQLTSQIVGQFAAFDAARRSVVSRFTVAQLAGSARSKSARSPAAAKDAMRRTKGRLSLLHSPSSHHDVRRLANGSCNH